MQKDDIFKAENQTLDNIVEVKDESIAEQSETTDDIKLGVVVNCTSLNVRVLPCPEASIVTVVTCLTEMIIDEQESTDDFYKVCTASGVEGFCMKKFIAVKQ